MSVAEKGRVAAVPGGGLSQGLIAYAIWGFLPLYFRLLHEIGPFEIVAHRIVWSVLFLAVLIGATKRYRDLGQALTSPAIVGRLAISATLIAANWLIYVWAVNADHVVAASLGYFLNPLINVLIGVMFLHEKLRRGQAVAVTLAAIGVAVLAWSELATLWISVALAMSFAFYGLVRKLTPVAAPVGLGVETLLLAPLSVGALLWFDAHGGLGFGKSTSLTLLIVVSGAVTSIPLMLFASAARKLPMVTLGLLQYVAPTLQFLCGVVIFGESLSATRWASFGLIWGALALFVWDSLRARKAA